MSYILDALRRADAERQRGAVPGLNTHPSPMPQADGSAGSRSVALPWIVAGGGLLLAIAVAVWLTGRNVTPASPPTASEPAAAAPASAPIVAATPMAPAPPAAASAVTAAPLPATTTVAVPPTSGSTTVTVTVTGPTAVPAVPPVSPARAAEPRSAAGARQAAPTAMAAAASRASASTPTAATHLPSLAELPEAVRRQLPPLALGGGMYSEQAAQRLVLVNGQVAHEGDEPVAGLRVLQIRPRSVVFSFQGQLFEAGL